MRCLVFLLILLLASPAWADISFTDGYWSTTFDCTEQSSVTSEGNDVCDGLETYGYYSTNDAAPSSLTSTSNYSGGDGGNNPLIPR